MAAQGAFGTDFFDRSLLLPMHCAYYRSGRPVIQVILQIKKFLSAEPTGVGRFLLSKCLILTFTRVNIGLRRKCVIQKL